MGETSWVEGGGGIQTDGGKGVGVECNRVGWGGV